jgi:hypothetical protein
MYQTSILALIVALVAIAVAGSITTQATLPVSASADKRYCFEGFDGDDNLGPICENTKKDCKDKREALLDGGSQFTATPCAKVKE